MKLKLRKNFHAHFRKRYRGRGDDGGGGGYVGTAGLCGFVAGGDEMDQV